MSDIPNIPNSQKAVYIYNENSARFEALYKHIINFHPNITFYRQGLIPISPDSPICKSKSYVFVLNETAIQEYAHEYSKYIPIEYLVFPQGVCILLETSKSFCREYLSSIDLAIYNPEYTILTDKLTDKLKVNFPTCMNKVIKADGLAGGKGVFVYGDHFQTDEEAHQILETLFQTHDKVLLEDKLVGEEFSLISLAWKGNITHFPLIKDFKRLNNGDNGPNTGGMGTISFAGGLMPFITPEEYETCCKVNEKVIQTIGFQGFLYGSFMKQYSDSQIKIIEYNVRLGDSEAVNILELLESSLLDYLEDPVSKPLIINRDKYTYFRYLVPKAYPKKPVIPLPMYFLANFSFTDDMNNCIQGIPYDNFYTADCTPVGLYGVHNISRSRTCGIFTSSSDLTQVCKDNDTYIQYINGQLHYRTDLCSYFTKDYKKLFNTTPSNTTPSNTTLTTGTGMNYMGHLNNYNHIITDTKEYIDSINAKITENRKEISVLGKIGDFANSVQCDALKVICSVDGAGTKTKFLENHPKRFQILGNDVVIHNINDMYCNNGVPIAFLDYYGCDKLNKTEFNNFIQGVMNVCFNHNIPLIGGETAEMRGIFTPNEVEVLGILLGILPGDQTPQNGNLITPGAYIYGINSNGAHTNGFTKLRDIDTNTPGGMPSEVKEFFSQPHKDYVNIMSHISHFLNINSIDLLGKAHITGGGFKDNIERIFSQPMRIELIGKLEWEMSSEWWWVYEHSNMTWEEFLRVFNAGWGFCFITNVEIPSNLMNILQIQNNKIKLLGRVQNA
jgi:phosphoribosylaminoimidazole synthetase